MKPNNEDLYILVVLLTIILLLLIYWAITGEPLLSD